MKLIPLEWSALDVPFARNRVRKAINIFRAKDVYASGRGVANRRRLAEQE